MDDLARVNETGLLELTSDIVSAFVSNNTMRSSELAELIASVHSSLATLGAPKPVAEPAPALVPAVSIKKSITNDYLICLDDGKKFKSLRRHISVLGMTPDEYRAKWGLPLDYPMVAPGYAATRSALAKATGLGSSRRIGAMADMKPEAAPEPEVAPESEVEEVGAEAPGLIKRRAGRPKKVA